MEKQHHFLIITLPAQGHINPSLQLAKNLSRAGARCTFVTTVNGFRKLNNLPIINGLFYDSFSDGYDDGIPKSDFGGYLNELKSVGSENLKKLIDKLGDGDGCPVTFIVYTFLFPWVAGVARECNVPSGFLAIQSATAFAIYHYLFSINNNGVYSSTSEIEPSFPIKLPELPLFSLDDDNLKNDPNLRVFINKFDKLEEKSLKILEVYSSTSEIEPSFPEKLPELPLFSREDNLKNDPNLEEKSMKLLEVYSSTSEIEPSLPDLPLFSRDDIPTFLLLSDPLSSIMIPIMREHIQNLENDPNPRVLINTFDKLEFKSLKLLQKIEVYSIGPLIPSAFSDGSHVEDKCFGCDLFDKSESYWQWLDSKSECSVVYVSFGSIAMLKEEQKEEVLQGLLESERPFLWVIRTSKEEDDDEEKKKKKDENYGLHGNGMIVPWCSQMEVLFHKSIGCFVSHCGWNSTLESMIAGVPLIGYPQFSDQVTNMKMVEDIWGTGVKARKEEGIVKREELKRCLKIIMGDGEKGNEIKKNVKKYRYLAMDAVKMGGSSYNNLNKFLESL